MSTGRGDLQPLAFREAGKFAAKLNYFFSRTARITANTRAKLHDRLVHLGLEMLFQEPLAASDNLLNVRTQLAR